MAADSVNASACLCPCVCGEQMVGVDTHVLTERPHKPTFSSRSPLSIKGPHVTAPLPPHGILSDWGKVLAAAQQEQYSVVKKSQEGGGRNTIHHLLPPSFPPPVPPSIQTQNCSGVTTRHELNGELIFPSGGVGERAIRHGSEAIEPLRGEKKPCSESRSLDRFFLVPDRLSFALRGRRNSSRLQNRKVLE